jgi:DNA repair protein RadD
VLWWRATLPKIDGPVNPKETPALLRDYQGAFKADIYAAWAAGHRNVMGTSATGSGKGTVIGNVLQEYDAPACVTVHRSPLVSQLALTLNREQVAHSIIGPKPLIDAIIRAQIDAHGKTFYRATAPIRVASTKTLAGRDGKDRWFSQCGLAIVDEGHHAIIGSDIDKSLALLPNARGLFLTAHACRADGLGLGRPTKENPARDGLVDYLVVGPHPRLLMDRGYLCDFDVICPPTDIDISDIPVGASGELIQKTLRERIHASKALVGSIVEQYLKRAAGKLGLTFVVDKEEAEKTAKAYRAAGVPCEIVTDETSIAARSAILKRYAARQLLQIVSVDVLGEGVDVPAVEVVSLGRHTESWQLFCQQVGRGTRPLIEETLTMPGPHGGTVNVWKHWGQLTDAQRLAFIASSRKPRFLIIDHVDNVKRHYLKRGLFDAEQVYTLDRVSCRSKVKDDAIPLRTCKNAECFKPYSAILLRCPYCGSLKPEPAGRGSPAQVEGDLEQLDLSVLRAMHAELRRINGAPDIPQYASSKVSGGIMKNHLARQVAQHPLRDAIAVWAGWKQQTDRLADREIHSFFWHRFGIDIMTAQTLGVREAGELETKIRAELERHNVVKEVA